MSISTYFRSNIHQNGPEILGVKHYKTKEKSKEGNKEWIRIARFRELAVIDGTSIF
jgi:hypothetical protein